MSIPGQYFCKNCLRPIPDVRNEGLCNSCVGKQMTTIRAGNFCDHCRTPATKSLIYVNTKTKKRYCVDCRSEFRMQLIKKGMETEIATKIMITDFILVNDPSKKTKIRR
ncbi:MAG: hypothetical protein GPJ54_13000 [Candidatus Heimdallarchaeota archaeon]|nr:hypothetical protein [Candidatus Heimdallarchaeota archaeon]